MVASRSAPKIEAVYGGVEQENGVVEDDEVNADDRGWECDDVWDWAETIRGGGGVTVDGSQGVQGVCTMVILSAM